MRSFAGHPARLAALLVALLLSTLAAAAQEPGTGLSRYDRGWHIVRPGENLHFITRKYQGDKLLWRENWKLNPEISDPDRLEPGQRIIVLIERRKSVPTAQLRSLAGQVEGKPAPIPWKLARELDLMLEEDGLRTATRASTEMEFQDGTRVLMTEDSVVYLRRRGRRLIGEPPRSVEIVEGQAEVAATQPPGEVRSIEILVGGTRATARPDDSGVAKTRARRSQDDSAKVMVYEGDSEVEAGGSTVEVGRGMGTSVTPGEAPSPPERLLPSPTGLRPEPGARLGHNRLELAWQPVAGAAGYTAELCGDPECALLVQRRTGLRETGWAPEPPPRGDYFWRVTAVSASGLDGYPSPGAALAILGGPDRTPPAGSLMVVGRQLRFGERLVVDESVRLEPRLEDAQSGVSGWQPMVDGVEVSPERWRGPWADGSYQVAVRATDRAGNEAVIAAPEPIVVDALPPDVTVDGVELDEADPRPGDDSRCGWLRRSAARWPSVTQCRWVRKAQRRWLRRGWSWLEVSVDGRRWNPLVAAGSEPALEVANARYRLPAAPTEVTVSGANPQLLVRSADGSALVRPDGGAPAGALRVGARDPGAGVERLRLRVGEPEPGVLAISVEAIDALGHTRELGWLASTGG